MSIRPRPIASPVILWLLLFADLNRARGLVPELGGFGCGNARLRCTGVHPANPVTVKAAARNNAHPPGEGSLVVQRRIAMLSRLVLSFGLLAGLAPMVANATERPVVVELFTSQ